MKEIQEFTKKKTKFFRELLDILQKSADLSSRVQENSLASVNIRDGLGVEERLANEDVAAIADDLAERTKDELIYRLYLVTKAYEATAYKAMEINWNTGDIFDKIIEQIELKKEFSIDNVRSIRNLIKPLFEKEVNDIKSKLLNSAYNRPNDGSMSIDLADEQLAELNETGSMLLNPFDFHHLIKNWQCMRLVHIDIDDLEFEDGTSKAPDNSRIELTYPGEGRLRVGEKILIQRGAPIVMTWTAVEGKWTKDPYSATVADLFKTLIGDQKAQLFALPPAWYNTKSGLTTPFIVRGN